MSRPGRDSLILRASPRTPAPTCTAPVAGRVPNTGRGAEIKPGDINKWPDHVVFRNEPETKEERNNFPFNRFVLIVGTPWYDPVTQEWGYNGYTFGDCNYYFCECPVCGKVGLQFDGRAERICGDKCNIDGLRVCNYDNRRFIQAYLMARQARFEHGEVL